MKTRSGFVSNSSSSSFIIRNKSNKELTIVNFVKENPQLIENFKAEYSWYKDNPEFTQENLIKSAEQRLNDNQEINATTKKSLYIIPANSKNYLTFGDEHGDIIGHVFDYILRDGGESENFEWTFAESNR